MSSEGLQEERSVQELYRRPGFLIRRAHQISVSMFLEECADLGITTTQYGAMVILRARQDLDQVGLARLVGIDRSTAALVLGKLETVGFVVRGTDPADKRRKVLLLSRKGHEALDRASEPARRAQERALSVFTPRQAELFLNLLSRFVTAFNEDARAPITSHELDETRQRQRRKSIKA